MNTTQSLDYPLHFGSTETESAIKKYIARCMLLLDGAFGKNAEVCEAFFLWGNEKFLKSRDPVFLLHENPLYFVARYLGIDPLNIDDAILSKAKALAHEGGW